jgi:hypothetical protein
MPDYSHVCCHSGRCNYSRLTATHLPALWEANVRSEGRITHLCNDCVTALAEDGSIYTDLKRLNLQEQEDFRQFFPAEDR